MKKAFEILSWLMLIAVIVLLMAFSVKNQQLVECQKFEVMVASSENHFINDKMINELLSNKSLHPLGKTRAEIAMDEIEKTGQGDRYEQLRIILIIIVSVSIFGLIVFVVVKNYIKSKIDYYLNKKKCKIEQYYRYN